MELDSRMVNSSASRAPKRQPGNTKPRTSDDLADWYDARLRLHGSRGDSFVVHRTVISTPERPAITPVPFGRANRQSTVIVPLRAESDEAASITRSMTEEPSNS